MTDKSQTELISVVIPFYKGERYLAEALRSVFDQTYRPLEVIVVDDGSPTPCDEILAQFDQPIHLIRQENQGVAAARNTGIRAAHGKYIALLDQDDVWLPEKLARQLELMQSGPGTALVFAPCISIDKNGRDRQGDPTTLPPGALRCVRPIAEGTTLRVLRGGDDAGAIIDSATQGAAEMMQEAQDSGAAPLLALLSTCCARGMRLRMFGKGGEDEVLGGILPVTQRKFPVFGFYAWGELGPIKGEYQGLRHQYQEHTFVGVLLCAPQHEDAG